MGSGSSTANQPLNQQLNLPGGLGPVTAQNFEQADQSAIAQAQQGNPMGIYNLPLETILGMGQMGSTPGPTGYTSQPQPSQQPVSSGDSIPSQTNVQPFFTPPNSVQGLDINQFVNPDGTAAPLGAQPNFVNQNQPPPWTPAQNNFSGVINGVPYSNGMLGVTPPPGGGLAPGTGTGHGTGGGNRAMMSKA